ncbi:MAG: PEGA domain-containing protein [Deltaproteobacteria bacterium]|nr:PEGA domain-containing protein [Kofleriaceae bacterium]
MGARRTWLVAALVSLCASVGTPSIALAQPDPEPEPEVEMPGDEPPLPEGDSPPEPPAEPDPATKAAAKKLLDGGDGFLKKGDRYAKRKKADQARAEYERALAAYTKAYELVPNPKIYYPMAIAEEKLEKWIDVATHLRRFLNQASDADAKMRADAEARLENAKLNIGVLKLNVTPEGAQVAIDGNPVGTTPLAEPIYLAPGEYALSITADGHKPIEQPLTVEAGSESERAFELESAAVIIDTPRPPPPPPEIPMPPRPSKTMLFVAGGATLAFFAGATTTGILAMGKNGTWKDENASDAAREDARQSGKSLALLTDGLILGTIVAGGLTAYYYTKIYKPKQAEYRKQLEEREKRFDEYARAPKVFVTPWVQAGGGGLVLTGEL